eukprot:365629-Chlamydomonas_euryale.AAC.6
MACDSASLIKCLLRRALHANQTVKLPHKWSDCSREIEYNMDDLLSSMLPVYKELLENGESCEIPAVWSHTTLRQLTVCKPFHSWACEGAQMHGNKQGQVKMGAAQPHGWLINCRPVLLRKQAPWLLPACLAFFAAGLRILVFSGDVDGIVPVVGSRRWTAGLGLTTTRPWQPWLSATQQVGGYIVEYEGLSFATVRNAGHMVSGQVDMA